MATKIRLRLLSISVAVAVALWITPAGTANAHPHQEERVCPKFEKLFQEYGLLPVKTFSYILGGSPDATRWLSTPSGTSTGTWSTI